MIEYEYWWDDNYIFLFFSLPFSKFRMPEYEYGCELHFPVLSAVGRAKQEEAVKQTKKQTLKSQQKNTAFTLNTNKEV